MAGQKRNALAVLGVAALLAPLAAFLFLRAFPQLDPAIMASTFHFYVVGFTAAAAAIACAVVMASARTLRETRLLFLGLAFFSIAGIFSVHGLLTPGFIVHEFHESLSVSAWLSVAAGAGLVALSATGLPRRVEQVIERNGPTFVLVAVSLVGAYIALSFTEETEHWLDWVPTDKRSVQFLVVLGSMGLTGFGMWRYYQAYQFARLPSQLAVVATLVLLLEVQVIILWGQVWHLSWWFYHGLYAVAFVVLFAGWAVEVRRAGTLRAIADALSMRDALAQLNRGLEARIIELVDAIEIKDREMFGHVRRVSEYALAIGRRLALSPSELRALALAAEMHDVGKISVPGSILAKPGTLTEEEFAVVKTHTERGYDIAQKVPALAVIANVVKHHHERLDGGGYPDGLAGEQIPLLARIIAVADTYDAMTSRRPYRGAMSHDEAMAELLREKAVTLDPRCVDSFVAVIGRPDEQHATERAAA